MATPPSTKADDLERLIRESEESIKRLEQLQKRTKPSLGQLFSSHFRRHGNNLVAAALAGSVFVVALGRLSQKYEHQAERDEWMVQRRKLVQEKEALQRQVAEADTLVVQVERAVASAGGRQLAGQVAALLEAHRQQRAAGKEAESTRAAAGSGEELPGKDSCGSQPPRLMI